MSETKQSILELWPELKEDLGYLLSDTDAWVITELKNASASKDWDRVNKLIDLMDTIHNISHSH